MELTSSRQPTIGRTTSLAASQGSQMEIFVPPDMKPAVNRCAARYKSFEGFLDKLGLAKQQWLVANFHDDLIYVPHDGKGHVLVPTLEIASMTFGYPNIQAWLMSYIANVNTFFLGSNPEKKMSGAQIEDAAGTIIDAYGKTIFVTEIPVIFMRIKSGRYGKAYGVIDGGMILNCFQLYIEARVNEKAEIHRRKEHEKFIKMQEEWAKSPLMSLDEWRSTVQYADLKMRGDADNIEKFAEKFGCDIIDVSHKKEG